MYACMYVWWPNDGNNHTDVHRYFPPLGLRHMENLCSEEDVAFEALLEKRVHQDYDKDCWSHIECALVYFDNVCGSFGNHVNERESNAWLGGCSIKCHNAYRLCMPLYIAWKDCPGQSDKLVVFLCDFMATGVTGRTSRMTLTLTTCDVKWRQLIIQTGLDSCSPARWSDRHYSLFAHICTK